MTNIELTKKEQRAIDRFKKAAEALPKSLWIWTADSQLYIMKKNNLGEQARLPKHDYAGIDPDYIVEVVEVESDGGDW